MLEPALSRPRLAARLDGISHPVKAARHAVAATWAQHVGSSNWGQTQQAWAALRSAMPKDYRLEPLYGLSCSDLDCIGVIEGSVIALLQVMTWSRP